MGVALVGYSFPSFFIGLCCSTSCISSAGSWPIAATCRSPRTRWPGSRRFILPWITLALLFAAFYTRLTRNQMLETLGEDYIRTARAKGLSERIVIGKHGLRAGLTPIVTAAGLDLAGLLGGAIITESIFSLPGLGALAIESVRRRRPAAHHRHHARGRHVRHRREPDRRPAVRRHRPAGEARMSERLPRGRGPRASQFPTEDGLVQRRRRRRLLGRARARRWPSSASPGSGKR